MTSFDSKKCTVDRIVLEHGKNCPEEVTWFLQRGFLVPFTGKATVFDFLRSRGIPGPYINEKIRTVFLNNSPVDNLKKDHVTEGSLLALSGAMPGLVGASLRAGSILASFRSTITFSVDKTSPPRSVGFVEVKLFNTILRDCRHCFLEKGIYLENSDDVVGELAKIMRQCTGVTINNGEFIPGDGKKPAFKSELICLTVLQ